MLVLHHSEYRLSPITTIMHDPLPHAHHIGVIVGNSEIVHRGLPRHHHPLRDHTNMPIGFDDVHVWFERVSRQEAVLHGQEGGLPGRVDGLCFGVLLGCLWDFGLGLDGDVDQVVVVVDPHMLDWLQLHLVRRLVVGPDLIPNVQAADGDFPTGTGDQRGGRKAQATGFGGMLA